MSVCIGCREWNRMLLRGFIKKYLLVLEFFCATFADGGLSDLGAPESRLDDPPLGISLIVTIGGTRG